MQRNFISFSERRAAIRYPVVLLVEFENGIGWTHDVSTTGVCFETDQRFVCGSSIQFVLNQLGRKNDMTRMLCNGVIVRAAQEGEIWRLALMMEEIRFAG